MSDRDKIKPVIGQYVENSETGNLNVFDGDKWVEFFPPKTIESLEADNKVLTAKVKELEVNLELALSLLGDGEHSFYLNG